MSPITGLTETRRIPRLGVIHLGYKVEMGEGKSRPKAADHFVVPPDYIEAFTELYGEKPKELDIIFPSEMDEQFASQWLKGYSRTRGLVCKGDGKTADRMVPVDPKTGELGDDIADRNAKAVSWTTGIKCAHKECSYYKGKQCREIMCLQFMLPDIEGLGVWQISTSSINSIINVNSCIAFLRTLTGGKIGGIPLKLTIEPQPVTPPDGKTKTVYVLHLRHQGRLSEILAASQKPLMQLLVPPPLELTAGEDLEAYQEGYTTDDPVVVEADTEEEPASVTGEPIEDPTEKQKANLPMPEKAPVVVEVAKAQPPTQPPTQPPKATPVPKSTPAPKAPDVVVQTEEVLTVADQIAKMEAGLPEGYPAKDSQGDATAGHLALLKDHAIHHGLDLGIVYTWVTDAATKAGNVAPSWEQMTQRQIYTLGMLVLKNSKMEEKNVNQGPGPESEQPAGSTERAEELAAADARDVSGAAAAGPAGGETGDADDDGGWAELSAEADAHR